VVDTFRNDSAATSALPAQGVQLGPMRLTEVKPSSMGLSYMGVDTLADTGSEVHHWGKKEIPAGFGGSSSMSCGRPNVVGMPTNVAFGTNFPVAWTAIKNKYFVQILAPEKSGAGFDWTASRSTALPGTFLIDRASAGMLFAGQDLNPGEVLTRKMTYYAGPKEYSSLKPLGNHQDDVMEFGFWEWFRWLCKALLWTLNGLYWVIPNYGIAVILLTLIVRILFWPVTHKSTESMKKMQEIQPLVNEVRAKFKDKPQKMNEEVMALYKKHKVNPMAGCLPMLVQIPVFIALFVVLRSAVELRFAPFLWVRDLSEPEGILSNVLPFGGLNILPLLMTATTVWQQKITPSTADPQQQKLMMFMPVVMLFLFYNMASGLVLYWTVSQGLAIVQLVWSQKKQTAAQKATRPAA
jgi:YidC/Oxa1 family membrane protein insertase